MKYGKFEIGTKVAYSVQFLSSIGMKHSDMAHARGEIIGFTELSKECVLAQIKWDCDMPERVNTKNLAKVGPNTKFCAC